MSYHFEVGLPYPCPEEQIWSPRSAANPPKCEFCAKQCHTIFMRVFFMQAPTVNYCSKYCWDNDIEVEYISPLEIVE